MNDPIKDFEDRQIESEANATVNLSNAMDEMGAGSKPVSDEEMKQVTTTETNRTIAEWVIPRPEWNAKWQVCSGYHTPAGLNWWTLPKDRNSITERDRIPIPVPNFCKDLNACHNVLTDERFTDDMKELFENKMLDLEKESTEYYNTYFHYTQKALTVSTVLAEVINEMKGKSCLK